MAIKDIKFPYQKFDYTTKYISDLKYLESDLNAFGEEGWELVSTWPQTIGTITDDAVLIFKRPKQ